MDVFAGPYAAAAVLLVVAAVLEVARPAASVRALAAAGFTARRAAVRVLAGVGGVVGVGALAAGGGAPGRAFATFVAVAYVGFAAFVARSMARVGPGASCGCFGRDAPARAVHVVVDLAGAFAAVAVAVRPGDGLVATVADQPAAGVPFVAVTALCAALALVVLTSVPGRPARRGVRSSG